MKRIVLSVVAVFLFSGATETGNAKPLRHEDPAPRQELSAGKQRKEQKKARKAEERFLKINNLIMNRNFQFLGYQMNRPTGSTYSINGYRYVRIEPGYLEVNLPGSVSFRTVMYEWQSVVWENQLWIINLIVRSSPVNGTVERYELIVNPKTAKAALKINSSLYGTMYYKGIVKEN